MKVLRTPDERFENLPGYDFEPHYAEVHGIRIHYVDENPSGSEAVLLMHGEPSWSYLYRKMIPPLVEAGFRVLAPDLVGFGRSDKPADRLDYTYDRHIEWMADWFDAVGLDQVTLFCQDWGGLIGLRLVARWPDRFRRIIASNTFLPTGEFPMPESFLKWQKFSQVVKRFDVGRMINNATTTDLPREVRAAYDAPFPDESYKEGARQFPLLVPTDPAHPDAVANAGAWEVLKRFDRPFLTAFGDSDPITAGADLIFRRRIPGARGQAHTRVEGGGHFIQEDRGEQLSAIVRKLIENTPVG